MMMMMLVRVMILNTNSWMAMMIMTILIILNRDSWRAMLIMTLMMIFEHRFVEDNDGNDNFDDY